jgi:hypothetical protein
MNSNAPVTQYPADCLSGRLPLFRAARRQTVQEFRQHLIRRNQTHVAKCFAGTDRLAAVLVAGMKDRSPVERIRENQSHFFFSAV